MYCLFLGLGRIILDLLGLSIILDFDYSYYFWDYRGLSWTWLIFLGLSSLIFMGLFWIILTTISGLSQFQKRLSDYVILGLSQFQKRLSNYVILGLSRISNLGRSFFFEPLILTIPRSHNRTIRFFGPLILTNPISHNRTIFFWSTNPD